MAKIYGWLERAQLENLGSDPSGLPTGRVWFRTDTSLPKVYDGAASRNFLIAGIAQIVNADVNASAAIAYSKLSLTGSIVNADVNSSAAIAGSKISPDFGAQVVQTTGVVQGGSVRTKYLGSVENLGLTLSAGVLTFCQADQTALSSTAPAYINLFSASTAGKLVTLKLTANKTLKDAASGSSDISTGARFDVSAGVAWGQARPFYLYAANLDDTDGNLALFISPNPCMTYVGFGDANQLGFKGTAPASLGVNNCLFLLSSSPAAYAGKPCVRIGGVTMTMDSSNNWTIGALDTTISNYGICSNPHVGRLFFMAKAQMGAAPGKFIGGSGTLPSWATTIEAISNYTYEVGLDGKVRVNYTTREMGNCTNGAGGQSFYLALPYATNEYSNSATGFIPLGSYKASSASPTSGILCGGITLASSNMTLYLADCNTALANNTFSNAADDFDVKFQYRPFSN